MSNEKFLSPKRNMGQSDLSQKLGVGPPILGRRKVRKIVLAAAFPEFYTAAEVDELHDLLDDNWAAKCRFFGNMVIPHDPHFNRICWRLQAGHHEAIRWVGSRTDAAARAPWWAGSVISLLINEAPQGYDHHLRTVMGIQGSVYALTKDCNEKKTL
ncbi:hypothetical protein BT69DRAFT_1280983 [Atractiella rhizophila]|nr:hypothetical protein BT69DRAFT_1280983 [Atractiella rhizophila]